MELCGGTHVSATGDIGLFAITFESGVSAGVRRIEAVTGAGAVQLMQRQRATLTAVLDALHTPEDLAVDAIERLQTESKRLAREATQLKTRLAVGGGGSAAPDDATDVAGVKLARRHVSDLDKDALRGLADSLKAKIKSGVVVLASAHDGKVHIVVAVTPDLTGRVKAGQIVKEIAPIVGGGGGGRPDFAEAGGKQPEKIDQMLEASEGVLARILTGAVP
jgi:alanyl-tRNA synthetase